MKSENISFGKILSWIFISILVFIVIIIGIVFIQTKLKPDKVPSIFGYKPFIVLSGSMETEIYKGDLVVVKNVDENELKKDDIIAFRDKEDYVVTHRIVEVINDGEVKFVTKGDNNNISDVGYVTLDNIEGVYVFKLSGVGNILLILQKPITLMFIIVIIFIGGFLWIAYDKGKMSKSDREELENYRRQANK